MARRSAAFMAAIIVLLGGLLASCATASAGPQAWIDKPLENTTAPLAPLSIIAHASADGGVASMEFAIDDQPYRAVAADGGRLVWQQVEWTPPRPGTYRVSARGIGANGAEGAYATSLVTISGEEVLPVPLSDPEALPVPLPQPPSLPEPATPSVVAKMNGNCREGPGTVYDAYGTLIEGQQAELKGRLADNSWLLVALVGQSMNCWISASVVEVQGNLASVQVEVAPPPPAVVEQPPPAVNVLPPAPVEVDASPSFSKIDAARDYCPADTVTAAAIVSDDKGLGSVVANWSLSSGESGQVALGMGELGYWATIGPLSTEGTLRIRIVATDTSGQSTTSNWLVLDFKQCID